MTNDIDDDDEIDREAFREQSAETIAGLAEEIAGQQNLDDLLKCLREIEAAIDEHQSEFGEKLVLENLFDIAGMPTYGREPFNTSEIYSWDDERFLVAGPPSGWTLEPRYDLEEAGTGG